MIHKCIKSKVLIFFKNATSFSLITKIINLKSINLIIKKYLEYLKF